MSKTSAPFGFDDVPDSENLPDGDWWVTVGPSTEAKVSKSGNPMVVASLVASDPELPGFEDGSISYWPARDWMVVRGAGAGQFRGFLTKLGLVPDEYVAKMAEKYDGGDDAAEVATFFNEVVVPDLVGRELVVRIRNKPAVNDDGEPITTKMGDPIINVEVDRYMSYK